MGMLMRRVLLALCILLGSGSAPSLAQDGVLNAIPGDAIAFAVVHDLAATSNSIREVAELLQAPSPDLLSMAKTMSGIAHGIDEQGDLAIVVTGVEPVPQAVFLVPLAKPADFFAALHVVEPTAGVVEVQLIGRPMLVGRKGDFAVIAQTKDRGALEKYLASTSNLADDRSLAEWIDASNVSIVAPSHGLKQLVPKLISGIRAMQANFRQMGGAQGQPVVDGLDLYVQMFTAAEPEVNQFGVALRVNSARTVDLVKRIQFTPDGSWAKLAAAVKPVAEELLTGLPAGPFVMATGGVVPPRAMEHMMKFSVEMMQKQPMYNLTPEQAQKYGALSTESMRGIRSMEMLIGVAEPGTGIYGNTTVVMTVDDSKSFLERYEKTLAAMREFAEEVKSPAIPIATSKHIQLGDKDALEISMELPQLNQIVPPGGPDPQKMMQFMLGSNGKLTIYMAAADGHTIIMSYTSAERLQSAIHFFDSKRPGLLSEAGVAEVAAALPPGSQAVAFVSIEGMAQAAKQFVPLIPGARLAAIPDFSNSPPIGMAAKVSATGVELHLVVTAGTLQAIGDTVAKVRGAAPGAGPPPQQQ